LKFHQTTIYNNRHRFNLMKTRIDQLLMFYWIRHQSPGSILEVGMNQGQSLGILTEDNKQARTVAVDIILDASLFQDLYGNLDNVSFAQADSLEYLTADKFDFIQIDTDHTERTLPEIQKYIKNLNTDGVLLIDDYPWSGVDQSLDVFLAQQSDWVPFLMSEQTLFLHHRSRDDSVFLDEKLEELFGDFCLLENIDYKQHVVKRVSCPNVINDDDEVFDLILKKLDL